MCHSSPNRPALAEHEIGAAACQSHGAHGKKYTGRQLHVLTMTTLKCFCNASFGGDNVHRKSTSGTVTTYNGSPISWTSRKKTITAMPTAADAYVAVAVAAQHLQVVKRMCTDRQLKAAGPCTIKCDNQDVCDMLAKTNGAKNQRYIVLRHQLLQQVIRDNDLKVFHVPSTENIADMLTKPMKLNMFVIQCKALRSVTVPPNGGSESDKCTFVPVYWCVLYCNVRIQ